MRFRRPGLFLATLVVALGFALPSWVDGREGMPATLVIGDDQVGKLINGMRTTRGRPGVLLAWRNSQKVLEIEVRVQNFSSKLLTGKLFAEVIDREGSVLVRWPRVGQEVAVALPANVAGGAEGKRFKIIGNRNLNLLIDRLDRVQRAYSIRATLIPTGSSVPVLGQIAAKTYNVPMAARPGATVFYEYWFRNNTGKTGTFTLHVDKSTLPRDWQLSTSPSNGDALTLSPGQAVQGTATMRVPKAVATGQWTDIRFNFLDRNNVAVDAREWYLVYDTAPPSILETKFTAEKSGVVNLFVKAADEQSGIREASGVMVEYSTNGGITWSSGIIAYLEGNFILPTSFITSLGPFRSGTTLLLVVTVIDTAGNVARTSPKRLVVP